MVVYLANILTHLLLVLFGFFILDICKLKALRIIGASMIVVNLGFIAGFIVYETLVFLKDNFS